MLKCANNFSVGHGTKTCDICGVLDNESHRINDCTKWRDVNVHTSGQKINYDDIYSDDTDKCWAIVSIILSMWDLENGRNEMRMKV